MIQCAFYRFVCAVTAALIAGTAPAAAEDFPRKVGGWVVAKSDDGCGMIATYEGPGATTVTFSKRTDGDDMIAVLNNNWSSRDGEKYAVRYRLNGSSYSGGSTIGFGDDERRGFFTLTPRDFEADFAAGTSMVVELDGKTIDQLLLRGTGEAVAAVNRCLAQHHGPAMAARRERERWDHLPEDPFAAKIPAPASVVADLTAPLRAAQATAPAAGNRDAEMQALFQSWRAMDKSRATGTGESGVP